MHGIGTNRLHSLFEAALLSALTVAAVDVTRLFAPVRSSVCIWNTIYCGTAALEEQERCIVDKDAAMNIGCSHQEVS